MANLHIIQLSLSSCLNFPPFQPEIRLGQYPHQKDIISYPYPWAKKDIISYQYPQKIRDIYHILYHILFWREILNGIGITHILYAVMTT